jgi:hypothetical protein
MGYRMAQNETKSQHLGKKKSKAVYKKPSLLVYGNVRELTAGVGGTNYDPGHSNVTKKGT